MGSEDVIGNARCRYRRRERKREMRGEEDWVATDALARTLDFTFKDKETSLADF